jgi:hypothetical protein
LRAQQLAYIELSIKEMRTTASDFLEINAKLPRKVRFTPERKAAVANFIGVSRPATMPAQPITVSK